MRISLIKGFILCLYYCVMTLRMSMRNGLCGQDKNSPIKCGQITLYYIIITIIFISNDYFVPKI